MANRTLTAVLLCGLIAMATAQGVITNSMVGRKVLADVQVSAPYTGVDVHTPPSGQQTVVTNNPPAQVSVSAPGTDVGVDVSSGKVRVSAPYTYVDTGR